MLEKKAELKRGWLRNLKNWWNPDEAKKFIRKQEAHEEYMKNFWAMTEELKRKDLEEQQRLGLSDYDWKVMQNEKGAELWRQSLNNLRKKISITIYIIGSLWILGVLIIPEIKLYDKFIDNMPIVVFPLNALCKVMGIMVGTGVALFITNYKAPFGQEYAQEMRVLSIRIVTIISGLLILSSLYYPPVLDGFSVIADVKKALIQSLGIAIVAGILIYIINRRK